MQSVRNQAQQHASAVIANLVLPENTALAATGSFARGEMTTKSDLDLVLLYDPSCDTDALFEQVEQLWYPIWDAKLRLDYSVRTPEECAAIVSEDPIAALSLLEITHVRGAPKLTEKTRELVVKAWRIQLKRDFSAIVDTAIARWRRSGSVVSMTKPDLKHGRGGLRDEELLKALALGNLCDAPDLSPQRRLLIDVRTMLHEHAGRARDVLDPEFAADIALGLGFTDRYELARAIAEASRTIDDALTTGLTVARNTLPKRKLLGFGRSIPRRPHWRVAGGNLGTYGASIHHSQAGEWDFDTKMKPLGGHHKFFGWVRAIMAGQRRIHRGEITTGVPTLVLSSHRSSLRQPLSLLSHKADTVVDVEEISLWSAKLATDITYIQVINGMHDLFLSPREVRNEALRCCTTWLNQRKLR